MKFSAALVATSLGLASAFTSSDTLRAQSTSSTLYMSDEVVAAPDAAAAELSQANLENMAKGYVAMKEQSFCSAPNYGR